MSTYNLKIKATDAIKKAARVALDSQSACNSLAVINSLAMAVRVVKDSGVTRGEELNQHPIVVVYLTSLGRLARIERYDPAEGDIDQEAVRRERQADTACCDLSEGVDVNDWPISPLP